MSPISLLISLPFVTCAFAAFASAQSARYLMSADAETPIEETAQIYKDIFSSYHVFPPLTANSSIWQESNYEAANIRPIQVIVGTIFTSVDEISPGSSRFTVSSRTLMYWKTAECNQTNVHQLACSAHIDEGGGFKFLMAQNAIDSKMSLQNMPGIHSDEFARRGLQDLQPDADISMANQVTIKQTFDERWFPFEFHELEINYQSVFTTNVVNLAMLPDIDPGLLEPEVPPGWTLNGISCEAGVSGEGRALAKIVGADLTYATFRCRIAVSRTNPGWWITSFLLFACLIIIAFLGSLGILSKYVAEARDDKDEVRQAIFNGTRLEGTFTIGLLLVYVFQVEISPYGQPVEFWPQIPTSTMIYCLGLVAIMAQSAAGLLCSLFFSRPLSVDGFVGSLFGPYKMDLIPKEGEAPEEDSPLIVNSESELPRSKSQDDIKEKDEVGLDDEETPMDPAPAFSSSGGGEKIARTRKRNQKTYNVLSVEEARIINKFARNTFLFKVALISLVALIAFVLLVVARVRFDDLVEGAT